MLCRFDLDFSPFGGRIDNDLEIFARAQQRQQLWSQTLPEPLKCFGVFAVGVLVSH